MGSTGSDGSAVDARGVSAAVVALLAAAEERVRGMRDASDRPPVDAEVEALLPVDLVAALNDALDADDEGELEGPVSAREPASGEEASSSWTAAPGSTTGAGTGTGLGLRADAGAASASGAGAVTVTVSARPEGASRGAASEFPRARENGREANGEEVGRAVAVFDPSAQTIAPRARASLGIGELAVGEVALVRDPPCRDESDERLAEALLGEDAERSAPGERSSSEGSAPGSLTPGGAAPLREGPPREVVERPAPVARPSLERAAATDASCEPLLAAPPAEAAALGTPPSAAPAMDPVPLGPGGALMALALAVRERWSGTLTFEQAGVLRRVVLHEGDFVTVFSGADDESVVAYLAERGVLARPTADALRRRTARVARPAIASLIAQGHLEREQLWPRLRAYSLWLLVRLACVGEGTVCREREIPHALADEPNAFGGLCGARAFVDVVRRGVTPASALSLLGGGGVLLLRGNHAGLLDECALGPEDAVLAEVARGAEQVRVDELARGTLAVAQALVLLGVLTAAGAPRRASRGEALPDRRSDALDVEAARRRLRARRALVDEGSYFAILGVRPDATEHELREAYDALRDELDPRSFITAATADLAEDLDLVLEILDEAYEILRDPTRRERYRAALMAR